MIDETETIRREMVATINADPGSRPELESKHGQVWDTSQLQDDFQVLGFHGSRRRRASAVGWSSRQPDVPERSSFLLLLQP